MPTGVQLSNLISALRAECGHSLSVAQGTNSKEHLAYLLRRVQEQLYTMHDWPMRMSDTRIALDQGIDHYAYPTGVDPEQVNWIDAKDGTEWLRLEYGITPADYSAYDPDADELSWPPRKWRHDPDANQIQIWPKPLQDGTLWIRAQRSLPALVSDSDTCVLDSNLIVLYAAAEVLARQKSEDAQLKLGMAQSLLSKLLAQQSSHRRGPWIMGGGTDPVMAYDKTLPFRT